MDKLNPLLDSTGKPSAMRAASLLCVGSACAMLVGAAFGVAEQSMAQEALWLTGIGIGGKFVQKVTETRGKKDPE